LKQAVSDKEAAVKAAKSEKQKADAALQKLITEKDTAIAAYENEKKQLKSEISEKEEAI
jgi:hypothetical protein